MRRTNASLYQQLKHFPARGRSDGIVDSGTPAIYGIRMNPLADETGLTVASTPLRRSFFGCRYGPSFQPVSYDRVRY
jgi:hypothetical protein